MAVTEAWSIGPSHIPLPWMQANSPPDRLTPRRRYVVEVPLRTSRLPETCSAGAVPGGGDVVVVVVVGGRLVVVVVVGGRVVVVGGRDVVVAVDVVVTPPVHVTLFSVNVVGLGLLP